MTVEKMFEVATREKYRFPFRGQIDLEQLWDLSLQNLDHVFKTLNSQVKQSKEESLLNTKPKEDEILDTQIEIIKYIVSVKLVEKETREKAVANKEMKQRIMQIKAARQDKALAEAPDEELDKLLSELV